LAKLDLGHADNRCENHKSWILEGGQGISTQDNISVWLQELDNGKDDKNAGSGSGREGYGLGFLAPR